MKRRIIQIDQDRCDGCGLCAEACHEGAIEIVAGKARLMSDEYCDGLGNCLPQCPNGAIAFIEKDTLAFDEEAVRRHQAAASAQPRSQEAARLAAGARPIALDLDGAASCGCPGTAPRTLARRDPTAAGTPDVPSELRQWPVQIALVNVRAPYLRGADLLVAADCTAYAYGAFHRDFVRGRIVLIGCPKLDDNQGYTAKLAEIFAIDEIRSVKVVRMEVPCCSGIVAAVRRAILASGAAVPYEEVVIGIDGAIQSDSANQAIKPA